jgi:small subunit ribosomal protein S1
MEFKIVKLNPVNENIVVSHKALIEKDLQAQRQTILATMEPGQILQGIVKNITDFGVFIDLGGVDGLLHITDLSWGRVSHPSELVTLDEELNVVVLDYDKERQRISLGLKQLQPHPWEEIEAKFNSADTVEGKVVSITDYGAFVELQKGIEGLVHISEMSWTEHIRHPSQIVSLGQLVQVKILNIDTDGKKISLGMKQLEPDPWQNIADRYPPGTVMNGKVRNITNFGVFVEIEPGIDGLVHISDLSWTKRIRHPSEMVKKGQELDVVVLNIDTDDRRISLGHKQVETNPWNQLAQVYAEGQLTPAKVLRIENKGLIVELPLEVEAFVPAGELKNGTTLASSYPVDHEFAELTIIRFAAGKKEIILSETAEGIVREREERDTERREKTAERKQEKSDLETHMRNEESSAGPTTVGELSGLADLKAKLEAQEAEAAADAPVIDEAPEVEAEAEEVAVAEEVAEEKVEEAVAEVAESDTEPEADAAEEEKPKDGDVA